MRRISFFVILFGIFLIISSILLLIWWPTKATLVEITNSWVAVIMVYIILVIFLYEKPLYQLFNEFINNKKPAKHLSQQTSQKELFKAISDDDFTTLAYYYHNSKWEDLINKENNQEESVEFINEAGEYIRELHKKRMKWCFLFSDIYLVLQAKYVLFWFYKFKNVNLQSFHQVWEEKVSDFNERDAILQALLNLEFLKKDDNKILLTELGIAYVNYLKKLDHQANIDSEKDKSILEEEKKNEEEQTEIIDI